MKEYVQAEIYSINEPSPFMKMLMEEPFNDYPGPNVLSSVQAIMEEDLPAWDFSDELTNNELDTITNWLNDPGNHQYSILLARSKPMTAGPVNETGYIDDWMHRIEIIRRTIYLSEKWWMDIAIRNDTSEPVLMVTHKGDYKEFRQQKEKKT